MLNSNPAPSVARPAPIGSALYSNQLEYFADLEDNYEDRLARMSLAELSEELQCAQQQQETVKTVIIEHMLAVRLSGAQRRGARWRKSLNLAAVVLALISAFYLGQLSVTGLKQGAIDTSAPPQKSPSEETN